MNTPSVKGLNRSPEHDTRCLDHQRAVDWAFNQVEDAKLQIAHQNRILQQFDSQLRTLKSELNRLLLSVPLRSGGRRRTPGRDGMEGFELGIRLARIAEIRADIEKIQSGRDKADSLLREFAGLRDRRIDRLERTQSNARRDGCVTILPR